MRRSVEIDHRIAYRYDQPVALSEQTIRLCPSVMVKDYSLSVLPATMAIKWFTLARGWMAVTTPAESTTEFSVRSRFIAEVDDSAPHGVGSLMDVCREVHSRVAYIDRPEPRVQDPEETLELRTGSCRDIAWLLVKVLRGLDKNARFVSGYYVNPEVNAAELHAWVEVSWNDRWLGVDPTLCCPVGKMHIPLISARSPSGATPIAGGVTPETGCELSWEIACRELEPCAQVDERVRIHHP